MAIFIPEVFANALQTEFTGNLVLGTIAAQNNQLEGQPGDKVNLPYYSYIGKADTVAAGDAMTPVSLAGNKVQITITKAGKAVEVTDEDLMGGVGVADELNVQLGRAIAEAVDSALMTAAMTTSLFVGDGSANIGTDLVVDAQAKLGDKDNGAILIIHSKQRADLYKDSNFKDFSKVGAPVMIGGFKVVGELYGMPVVCSDTITLADSKYTALVIKPNALVLAYKRQPVIETDRNILKGTTLLAANVHYGAALARPEYAVKVITK